jgi:ATP-dependent Clp protease ATP-binding subunit ClpC
LNRAYEYARDLGHERICTHHVLLALSADRETVAGTVLAAMQVSTDAATAAIEHVSTPVASPAAGRHIPFSPATRASLILALHESRTDAHAGWIGSEHLLLGLLDDPDDETRRFLRHLGLAEEELRDRTREAVRSGRRDTGGVLPMDNVRLLAMPARDDRHAVTARLLESDD